MKQVIVIGGGFAGLEAVQVLRGTADLEITLIDRRNHHVFQPLLYQVATASLNPSDIASPLRRIFAGVPNLHIWLGEVARIDLAARQVHLSDGANLRYDGLILAPGASHSYFGHDEFAAFAPGLKSLEDAVAIRGKILNAFERAERSNDPTVQKAELCFVVIGGGPTGVELAGALSEIARDTLVGEFSNIDPRTARVLLIEGEPRLLPSYPEALSQKAEHQLRRLGVEVRLHSRVTHIDEEGVAIGEERIACRTVLWAAGVRAAPILATLAATADRAGRILVAPDLSVPGHPEAFVIGDAAAVVCAGKPVPGVAPAAKQQGRAAAQNLLRLFAGKPSLPFAYRDHGSLATIGRAAAVADFGRIRLSGFVAWISWLLVHIAFLIGFRNRAAVLFDWAWAYLTRQRPARLITWPRSRDTSDKFNHPND